MRRSLVLPTLLVAVAACDSGADQTTCLRATVTYAGAAGGPAYVKVTGSDGNLYLAHQAPSASALIANPPVVCFVSQTGDDVALTAVAWIDAAGVAATVCADVTADTCAPAAADPQGSGTSVLHMAETTNEVGVVVTDPAPPAG